MMNIIEQKSNPSIYYLSDQRKSIISVENTDININDWPFEHKKVRIIIQRVRLNVNSKHLNEEYPNHLNIIIQHTVIFYHKKVRNIFSFEASFSRKSYFEKFSSKIFDTNT